MTCSRCSNARAVWLDDDTTALGGLTVPCGRCCCKDCGSLLDAPWGYCAFGCRLREEYRTAKDWTAAAIRMQLDANAQTDSRRVTFYCRRRNYCARKAEQAGGEPWKQISEAVDVGVAAGFSHVFEASAVLQ